jgi:hypothetical protein
MKKRWLLPNDWATAANVLQAMLHAFGNVRLTAARSLVGFAVPFAAGSLLAWRLMDQVLGADKDVLVGIAGGVLSFCGILVGFAATLMLFTGRIDRPTELTLEQLRVYAAAIRHLLVSQAMTLFVALGTSLCTLAWMLLLSGGAAMGLIYWLGVVTAGLTGVSLVRMFLLPFQIYELHEAWLKDVMDSKERELAQRYSRPGNGAGDE